MAPEAAQHGDLPQVTDHGSMLLLLPKLLKSQYVLCVWGSEHLQGEMTPKALGRPGTIKLWYQKMGGGIVSLTDLFCFTFFVLFWC